MVIGLRRFLAQGDDAFCENGCDLRGFRQDGLCSVRVSLAGFQDHFQPKLRLVRRLQSIRKIVSEFGC